MMHKMLSQVNSNQRYSLVICQNSKGQFLAVQQKPPRGWWIPGGHVEEGQTFQEAAIRETKEEAGIEVKLLGVIRFEQSFLSVGISRQRMIFYAKPKNQSDPLKSKPDEQSLRAKWVTLQEYSKFQKIRGPELLNYGKYILQGGPVMPVGFLANQLSDIIAPKNLQFSMEELNSYIKSVNNM